MSDRAALTLAVAFPSHVPRPLDGAMELALASELSSRSSRPAKVTGVLSTVFAQVSGQDVSVSRMRRLASGAREWLLQQAAQLFWRDTGWFQASCANCNTSFDIPLQLSHAPVKSVGAEFPVISLKTTLGLRRFEAPNGLHEEHLSQSPASDPVRSLVAQCALSPNALDEARAFSSQDLIDIEAALDATCPEVADQVATHCPHCKAAAHARIDPLEFAFPSAQGLLGEVHQIARAYHWSEEAILALPRARRRAYAGLIGGDIRR